LQAEAIAGFGRCKTEAARRSRYCFSTYRPRGESDVDRDIPNDSEPRRALRARLRSGMGARCNNGDAVSRSKVLWGLPACLGVLLV